MPSIRPKLREGKGIPEILLNHSELSKGRCALRHIDVSVNEHSPRPRSVLERIKGRGPSKTDPKDAIKHTEVMFVCIKQ